jgi:hypothetical protein
VALKFGSHKALDFDMKTLDLLQETLAKMRLSRA